MNILEIEGNMRAGTRIELEIRKFMKSYCWRMHIIEHIPNRSYTDVQETGPFAIFQHRHEFKPQVDGTLLRDEINLQLPHYPLTWPIEQWIVKPQLDALFSYRHEKTKRLLQKQAD
jgi:ligand-binding SRPBCC domain-containing protein